MTTLDTLKINQGIKLNLNPRPWLLRILSSLALHPALVLAIPLDYQAPPVDNPLKGMVPYKWSSEANRFSHSLTFSYFSLSDILTGQNSRGEYLFDWSKVENFFNDTKARGNQSIIRIYSEYPGRGLSIPSFLTAQGVQVNELPYDGSTTWTPDYENTVFLNALRGTISKFGELYDGDPRIGFLELGLLGVWGEWHNFETPSYAASPNTQNEVMNAFEAAFQTTKLLVRNPEGGTGLKSNRVRKIGYHDDSFTFTTLGPIAWHFWPKVEQANAVEKWKTEVIGGELFPQLNACVFKDLCSHNGKDASNFLETVKVTHSTYVRLEGIFSSGVSDVRLDRAKIAVRQMGYDLHFNKVVITQNAGEYSVAATLENRGVAPFYYDWPMILGLLDADGTTLQEWPTEWKLNGLLPDNDRNLSFTFTPNVAIPEGARIAVRVPNPMTGGRPLRFSNFNQQLDGEAWMIFANINDYPPAEAQ